MFNFSFVAVAFGLQTVQKIVRPDKKKFLMSEPCSICLEAPYHHTSSLNSDLNSHVRLWPLGLICLTINRTIKTYLQQNNNIYKISSELR